MRNRTTQAVRQVINLSKIASDLAFFNFNEPVSEDTKAALDEAAANAQLALSELIANDLHDALLLDAMEENDAAEPSILRDERGRFVSAVVVQ